MPDPNNETAMGKQLRTWTLEDVVMKPQEACEALHVCANVIDDLVARLSREVNNER